MGDVKGFLKVKREASFYRPVCERLKDCCEVAVLRRETQSQEQASRCMDCGTPFCNWGCPLGNYIPEWNDWVFRNHWDKAWQLLEATNNLPEITGRLCPAPCEFACVLGINDDPVTIREDELDIAEHAFKKGWVEARKPSRRTGKKVCVVGSGPAGLSCADQLNQAGHTVVVFERDDKMGGILRYGIPDFKLEKKILDRRLDIWKKEGIKFVPNTNVGVDYPAEKLLKEFDAICLAGGSRHPRDLDTEGRRLQGIHFAMEYLIQANKRVTGAKIPAGELIDAKGKKVVVLGGGDTGADCVGTASRQKAACVVQIELLPKPSECRGADCPWPKYPSILKISTSHEEGGERRWSISTEKFLGENGRVKKLLCVRVEFEKDGQGRWVMNKVKGSKFEIEADLIILALGFLHPEKRGLLERLSLEQDPRGNVKTDENYLTSVEKVFSCGDMRRGQSLIVWAIAEGRRSAHHIDKYLTGKSVLPII
jgi:glutamate synthase (NADPH) small chain